MPWAIWLVTVLAAARFLDGARYMIAGLGASLGREGWLWVDPLVSRALSEAAFLTTASRLVILTGYLLVAWMVWRRDDRAWLFAAGFFLADLVRWAWISSSASSAAAQDAVWLDLIDVAKIAAGALIAIAAYLARPRSLSE